jgi:phospholipid N-methyltransferase
VNSSSCSASQLLIFAKNFFKHPKLLGSVIPSSRYLVQNLLSHVDWKRASVIVEYGPGIGNMTREILNRMRPDAVLVAVELNPEFAEFITREIDDSRLKVVCRSAGEICDIFEQVGLKQADYVISGIPYSTMPEQVRRKILRDTRSILQPQGGFLIYQFTRTVLPHLQPIFANVQQGFEPRNILPARLFFCTP